MEPLAIDDHIQDDVASSNSNHTNNHKKNQCLLVITAALFALFVIAEVIGALAGNSLSLLGDAAAMSVDVMSYFSNIYAERVKARGEILTFAQKMRIEVIIPIFSACALGGVSGYVGAQALEVILHPNDEGKDVSVTILFAYASVNMLIDLISNFLFIRKQNQTFYVKTARIAHPHLIADDHSAVESITNPPKQISTNMNMLSAFAHITGDTLRTLAVFAAAIMASTTRIPASLCDAWAAVLVTITIIGLLIPLCMEIYKKYKEIMLENAKENSIVIDVI